MLINDCDSDTQDNGGEQQIIYKSTSQLWYCCGTSIDGTIDCSYPAAGSFMAPPPGDLTVLYATSATSTQDFSNTFTTNLSSASVYHFLTADIITPTSSIPVASSSASMLTGIVATPSPSPSPSAASGNGGSGLSMAAIIGISIAAASFVAATSIGLAGLYYTARALTARRRESASRHARTRGGNSV